MKTCSRCGDPKNESEFNRKGTGLQPYCRPCSHIKFKEYYHKNRERQKRIVIERNKRHRAAVIEFVCRYLQDNPCIDCGENDIVVLDFDHVRGDKVTEVTKLVQRGCSLRTIREEISKCEVVCANCHRRRTAKRGGYYRVTWAENYGSVA